MEQITLFWHRRDLRFEDNTGLYSALKYEKNVQPIFIFDTDILDKLPRTDKRVDFIHDALIKLRNKYAEYDTQLWVFYGKPREVYSKLIGSYNLKKVYANRDYEPYAQKRDKSIYELLKAQDIEFLGKKDHVVFEKNEVLKKDDNPYTVFTPYSKIWKSLLTPFYYKAYPVEKYVSNLYKSKEAKWESVYDNGFHSSGLEFSAPTFDEEIIQNYQKNRDFPAKSGTTKLSVHLRFGTISIRKCVAKAIELQSGTWLNELIWRDFYHMILYHFPHVAKEPFRSKYKAVVWENNEDHFKAWCEGKTGYPLVDAGMRELNGTGFMHNRVRMVVASFLTKHLLIDWRWGEAYFAEKLLDFDLPANNGGWQWAAGCGTDAAPYFRVFNPTSQLDKFDKNLAYVKQWVPEYGTDNYANPIVEHKAARQRALDRYKEALT